MGRFDNLLSQLDDAAEKPSRFASVLDRVEEEERRKRKEALEKRRRELEAAGGLNPPGTKSDIGPRHGAAVLTEALKESVGLAGATAASGTIAQANLGRLPLVAAEQGIRRVQGLFDPPESKLSMPIEEVIRGRRSAVPDPLAPVAKMTGGWEEAARERLARATAGMPTPLAVAFHQSATMAGLAADASQLLSPGMAPFGARAAKTAGSRTLAKTIGEQAAEEIASPAALQRGEKATGRVITEAAGSPGLGIKTLDPGERLFVARNEAGQDIGSLIARQEPDGGFKVRHVFVDESARGQAIPEDLYRRAHAEMGPYRGSTDYLGRRTPAGERTVERLRQTAPEVFEELKVPEAVAERVGEAGSVGLGPLRSARDWIIENFKGGGPSAGKYALAAREFAEPEQRALVRSIPGRIETMEGKVGVSRALANDIIAKAAPIVKQIAPSRKGQKALWEDLQAAAVGEKPLEEIPEALRPLVERRQQLIEGLQARGIDTGAFPEDMVEAISKSGGTYAHRTYRAFKDPKHFEKVVDTPDWYAARDFLKKEMPDAADGEIQDILQSLTKREQGTRALTLQQAPTRLNAILRERQAIPEPLRKIMGEEKDFRVALADTVGQMAHDIEAHNFWKELKEEGLARQIFRDPDVPAPAGYEGGLFRRIPGSNTVEGISSRGPVEGLLTREALRDALVGQFEVQKAGAWNKFAAVVNLGKTVFSFPAGHIRNFMAHHVTSAVNGKNPALVYTRAPELRRIFKAPDMQAMRNRLVELGLTDSGASSREVFDFINTIEEGTSNPLAQGTARFGKALGKSWRWGDNVWRAAHWLDEVEQLRWAMPEMPRPAIEELAANRVKDTFQTYSRAPEFARKLRRTPFGGPGVTFHAESVRNVKNIAKYAALDIAQGIKTSNPRLVLLGMRRAAGLMAAPVAVASIPTAGRMMSGMDRKQQEAARRRLLPHYHENAETLTTRFEPGKEMQYLDLSFMNPYSSISRTAIAAQRAMTQGQPPVQAVAEFLDQVSGGDIATKEFLQLAFNRRLGSIWPPEVQGPIANFKEEPAPWQGIGDLAYHGYRGLAPGGVVQAENLARGAGLLPSETETGRQFSLGQETLATFGARLTTQNIPAKFRSSLGKVAEDVASLRPRPPKDPALMPKKAENYLKAWEKQYRELQAIVADFDQLGMTARDMRTLAGQSRVPPSLMKAALRRIDRIPSPIQLTATGQLPESWQALDRRPLALEILRQWRERYR